MIELSCVLARGVTLKIEPTAHETNPVASRRATKTENYVRQYNQVLPAIYAPKGYAPKGALNIPLAVA